MTTIELYQPRGLNLQLTFPTAWNELSTHELQAVARAMLAQFGIPTATRASVFLDILRVRGGKKLRPADVQLLDPEQVALSGLPILDFLFQDNDRTEQPYPTLNFGYFRRMHGPASAFDTMTCGEFEDAEIFYLQFKHDPKQEPLARLASILWRPKGTPYARINPRTQRLRSYDSEKQVHRFRQLPAEVLYSIFIWYDGCRSMLPRLFPVSFEGDGGKKASGPDFAAFTKCIHAGAGPKNGSREQIRCTLLKEFFFEMEQEARAAKELTAKYGQRK